MRTGYDIGLIIAIYISTTSFDIEYSIPDQSNAQAVAAVPQRSVSLFLR